MYDNSPRMVKEGGSIALYSPYNPDFVTEFKEVVPYTARRWDHSNKRWTFTPKYASQVRDLVLKHYSANITVPSMPRTAQEVTRIVKLMYLGLPKPRDGGKILSYGWVDGGWTTLWPLPVLKAWFEPMDKDDEPAPTQAQTYYGVLGLKRKAAPADIKSAWRKLARRWHPDMNADPDAVSQMQCINAAYEVLKDTNKRARYDAGLKLTTSIPFSKMPYVKSNVWKPPYRCGLVMAAGIVEVGRLNVARILQWQDIINNNGQTLVTFWGAGPDGPDETFSERWV